MDTENKPKRKPPPNAGKGRPKGALNKTTLAVKDALQQTFDGIGGISAMITWASENQTAFYQLYGKLIPVEAKVENTHSGPNGEPIQNEVTIRFIRPECADVVSSS